MRGEIRGESRHKKRPYEKPEIKQITLTPEEAVLGGCKLSDEAGPLQAVCTVPSDCSSIEIS